MHWRWNLQGRFPYLGYGVEMAAESVELKI